MCEYDPNTDTFGPLEPKTCVILNGPPGCGKDTIAEILEAAYCYTKVAFKDILYKETADHYDFPVEALIQLCTDRESKETPQPFLGGRSPRGALQHVSERIIKPAKGKGYFGEQLALTCAAIPGDCVVSDGGFVEEVLPLLATFTNIRIVRLYREGCDFREDTREYLWQNKFPLSIEPLILVSAELIHENNPGATAYRVDRLAQKTRTYSYD
jgi:hypothetical protein